MLACALAAFGLVGTQTAAAADKASHDELVKRGEYLVVFGGCNDCHTPSVMGPHGPEKDMSRMLSGHPGDMKMPAAPKLPDGPWNVVFSGTLTAISGPWGISYTRNLTPDKETGLGSWTEEDFIKTMRTGREKGTGRPLLPPMPWEGVGRLTDSDLKAVFAYLQSIPAIKNRVPDPVIAPPPTPPAP